MQYFQVEYFLGIVRYGTMSAAARALCISQSTLSSALKNLEGELGCQLFDRVGRKLVLNDNGAFFLDYAGKIEGLFCEATDAMQARTGKRSSTVNCVLYSPLGNLGSLISGFKERFPEYKLRIGFGSAGTFDVFSQSDTDISIVTSPLHLPQSEKVVALQDEEYIMALPCGHPLAGKHDLRLCDFSDEDFVASVGGKEKSCFDPSALCEEAGFSPRVVCEVQWQTDALQLVEAGVGCCLAPEFTWLCGQTFEIAVRRLRDVKHHRHVYARLADHKPASPATKAFMCYLKDYVGSWSRPSR